MGFQFGVQVLQVPIEFQVHDVHGAEGDAPLSTMKIDAVLGVVLLNLDESTMFDANGVVAQTCREKGLTLEQQMSLQGKQIVAIRAISTDGQQSPWYASGKDNIDGISYLRDQRFNVGDTLQFLLGDIDMEAVQEDVSRAAQAMIQAMAVQTLREGVEQTI